MHSALFSEPCIQHCFLSELVYLNVKYVIAARNYAFFTTGTGP